MAQSFFSLSTQSHEGDSMQYSMTHGFASFSGTTTTMVSSEWNCSNNLEFGANAGTGSQPMLVTGPSNPSITVTLEAELYNGALVS